MVASRYPMLGMVYDDEAGRYIAKLERRCTVYQLTEIKMCALLELLTDEEWDTESILLADNDEIKRIATQAFQKRLGLSPTDAAALVVERWDRWNPAPAPDLAGHASELMRSVQAESRSPETSPDSITLDLNARVKDAMERKAARKAAAAAED